VTDTQERQLHTGAAEKLWVVRVRVRRSGRVFLFVTPDSTFKLGDNCLVNSDRGLEFGTVVAVPVPCEDENAERVLTRVVRRVTVADKATHEQNRLFEQEAYEKCREMINERGMQMKLVKVESTFDRKKVVFYFSSEERVDFRDLVKELATVFRTRIELRQIGVRDEARLIGGLGVCGRRLCCSTFLREFSPVSIRMAKKQNLALNPAKISGLCGRLMCCILYEDQMYDTNAPGNCETPHCAECKVHEPAVVTGSGDDAVGKKGGLDDKKPPSAEDGQPPARKSNQRRQKRNRNKRRRRNGDVG